MKSAGVILRTRLTVGFWSRQVVPMVQERRREVGCQSDSVERRDAAVQVDLLTQQLGWRHCPGEPGEKGCDLLMFVENVITEDFCKP